LKGNKGQRPRKGFSKIEATACGGDKTKKAKDPKQSEEAPNFEKKKAVKSAS